MKSKISTLTFLFTFLLLFNTCEKDDGNSGNGGQQDNTPDTFSEYFGPEISRDFLGNVIDQNHNPIEGVIITIGNETAMTDSDGIFIIRNANINERFGYIKAEKAGYIHGSRSVVPSNGTNKVTIMLLEATAVGSVASGSSGTVTSNDGSSVSFDGDFIKEDGSVYSGTVDVIMHYLDPADDDMETQMPGMLYAENEDGEERMLQTLGMLAVELRGSSGEDLNLAEGATSEIKIPINASLISIAPPTIPLWYFDEDRGYWKEEGQATLQGNMYVGNVSHFSFWNLDAEFPAVNLCITLVNQENNPIANQRITLTHSNPDYLFSTSTGITNDVGEVCGLVPIDESLVLNVFSNVLCNDTSIHTETVGPFAIDSSITIIVSETPNIVEETVTGNFLTCDGEPVTNGYIKLSYDNLEVINEVTDGTFEISFYRCLESSDFTITAIDYTNSQSSNDVTYNFVSPLTEVGDILSCEDYAYSYIYFQVGNNAPQTLISEPPPSLDETLFKCLIYTDNNSLTAGYVRTTFATETRFVLGFSNFNGAGTYNSEDGTGSSPSVDLTVRNILNHLDYSDNNHYTHNFVGTAEIFTLGTEEGEVVEINFSGTLDVSYTFGIFDPPQLNEENVPISGYMHLIRDN
ncbi:hypothetical protein [Winogradskyella flava]|uniref:hypothetical protein n=1 Tax=Winogradskyella flava TaxID=1884876 RepID=UPI002492D3A6|nr:hypothetical protein [Winogradskyella flava]